MEALCMDMEIRFPGGKKVDALYKGFIIHTDQSVAEGGSELAPSPFSLFLASIGTCTGYYVLSFCQKNNIPTENIKLIEKIERNHETHMVESIHIDIMVPKEFPEKYKNALIKASEACAVRRHLDKPPKITTTVVKA
jgi:ribosomal protein S12 methylthiotransferase accessory factor